MLNVRAVVIDHYMSKPIPELYGKNELNPNGHWLEPVIRIFGSTPEGIKSCVHVHGVYPYMYVPYKGGDNPDRDALILGAALEEALKITFNQHKNKYVHKVTVISGIPLYGYHSTPRQFFKIFFYNPYHIRKASELLLNGAILNQKLQPHESHIPFVLQFMMDYNIYGMSFVTLRRVKHRRNPDRPGLLTSVEPPNAVFSEKVLKATCSLLEADALAADIANRSEESDLSANPGLREIWKSERARRRHRNLPSQFTAEGSLSRRSDHVEATELLYKQRLAAKLREVVPGSPFPSGSSDEPEMTYPAEVSESNNLLEASALLEDKPEVLSPDLPNVSLLINDKVLSQQRSETAVVENGGEEDAEGIEAESILGKLGNEEAELETDEDDGGDMTQPLDAVEDVAASQVSDSVIQDFEEDEFWQNMADKIMQIDGAQDSSSDSDVDSTLKPTAPGPTSATAIPITYLLDRDFAGDSTRCHQIIGSSESTTITTNVSNSFLTFLSEAGRPPVPLIISQPISAAAAASFASFPPPRSDLSPVPQLQESWPWDKTDVPFVDLLPGPRQSQIATATGCDFALAAVASGRKSSDDSNSTDSLRSLFEPSSLFDDYGDMPSLSPCSNMASTHSEPSPTSALPSGLNLAAGSDLCGSPLDPHWSPTGVTSLGTFHSDGRRKAVDGDGNKSLSLMLKDHLRDIGDVVSVNLKTFNEREMVVIEYAPTGVPPATGSGQNKFIMKPLEKFLENCNNGEEVSEGKKRCDLSQGEVFQVSASSGKRSDRKRPMNREKAQNGKISNGRGKRAKENSGRRESADDVENRSESCRSCGSRKNRTSDGRSLPEENRLRCDKKLDELILNEWKDERSKTRKESNLEGKNGRKTETNLNLINRINSCFEDYFQKIVKAKTGWEKTEKNVYRRGGKDEEDEEEECDDDDEEEEVGGGEYLITGKGKTKRFARTQATEDTSSVKMVAQLLSEFSKMSQTRQLPPLHITINIGNGRNSSVRPGKVIDFRSSTHEKERKKCRTQAKVKKLKIPNVDGTADGSSTSSEDATDPPSNLNRSRKTLRGERGRGLNVAGAEQRKRKLSRAEMTDVSSHRDSFDDFSQHGLTVDVEERPGSSNPNEVVAKSGQLDESPPTGSNPTEEPDIIYDSDHGARSKPYALKRTSKKLKRKKSSARTGAVSSTEEASSVKVTAVEDTPATQSFSSQFESPFEASMSELDRTRYRIPGKWSKRVTEPDGESSSSVEMPLSGSPLCSPAVPSSDSLTPREVAHPQPSDSSSDTLKPSESTDSKLFLSDDPAYFVSLTHEKTVRPVRKPPTREEVRSFLIANEHLKEEVDVPYYSDARDVTKPTEAGPTVLRVESTAYAALKPFRSSLNVMGAEERRALLLNAGGKRPPRHLLVPDRNLVITPLKKPPSTEAVARSLESRKGTNQVQAGKSKRKVIVPLSPGQDSHSEEEMELSLSASILEGTESGRKKCKVREAGKGGQSSGESGAGGSRTPVSPGRDSRLPDGSQKVPSSGKRLETVFEEGDSKWDKSSSELVLKEGRVKSSDNSYQIRGPTLENTFGFDSSVENLRDVKLENTYQHITMLVMEVHVETRKDFLPDPQYDSMRALFYTVTFDSPDRKEETGVIVVGDDPLSEGFVVVKTVHRVPREYELVLKLVDLIRDWDPDILAGYEIEMHSWGYLVQRGFSLGMNLFSLLGRNLAKDSEERGKAPYEKEDLDDVPSCIKNMRIPGRIVLDVWRLLRHEVSLTSYTFENVMYHLSHERHHRLSEHDLSFYWEQDSNRYRHITLDYYLTRVRGTVQILDRLDFVNRTSEFARLFGIQFYEVLSRGSQFRVESMMLRLAKPLNYVAVSPNVGQRAAMRAPASLPLILEPESAFYSDPLIVLDFQSLYPSMIIAYNYCFSTCLGRVEKLGGREPFEFGCSQLLVPPEELKALEDDLTISPAGVAFVKEKIRKGILPTMLQEILDTRLMVKKSMKSNSENKLLQKVLFAQQLGLKLIANVTYGYTAANFSGRMPSVEIGDSVVSKGRETLHRAIQMVKNNTKWRARVVYGDTDSIFVLVPGRSRAEAFEIGAEIAEAVTRDNPRPVKLKLEKVYQPSILQTKKRYVGYMYESPDQKKPVFEAKGIETVRRDGCPAVGKILHKALQILFDTKDVSLVKKYTIRQFSKIFQGKVNLQDLIFAKEYRGRNGYRPGACVPALQLARQWTSVDKRAEPRVKERVPYVIVNGPPGVPLIKLVRSPMDLIKDPSLHVNAYYYITKAIIPPLHRCFSLMGVDVASWYAEMPRRLKKHCGGVPSEDGKKRTISQYFSTVECVVCGNITTATICGECQVRPQVSAVVLEDRMRRWEKCAADMGKICQSCCNSPREFDCLSMDCPILFRKTQAHRDLLRVPAIREALEACVISNAPTSEVPAESDDT